MDELIAKIRSTRDYENLKERLGEELGTLIYQLVDEADKAGKELDIIHDCFTEPDNFDLNAPIIDQALSDIKQLPKVDASERQPDLQQADVIRIRILPHYAGDYRLEYDGKYVKLFGRDKRYAGFKFDENDEDWYQEMVLIPCVVERRDICPEIISVDDSWISIRMDCH